MNFPYHPVNHKVYTLFYQEWMDEKIVELLILLKNSVVLDDDDLPFRVLIWLNNNKTTQKHSFRTAEDSTWMLSNITLNHLHPRRRRSRTVEKTEVYNMNVKRNTNKTSDKEIQGKT